MAGGSTARAEDAQGTPAQRHISPGILVYEDYTLALFNDLVFFADYQTDLRSLFEQTGRTLQALSPSPDSAETGRRQGGDRAETGRRLGGDWAEIGRRQAGDRVVKWWRQAGDRAAIARGFDAGLCGGVFLLIGRLIKFTVR